MIAVALTVFFYDGGNQLPPSSQIEIDLSPDEIKGLRLLRLAQETCLSGESSDVGVNIDLSTDYVTSFKQISGVRKDKARGAVNYVDDQVRAIVDKDIRNCLQKHMPQIQACLLGNCGSASMPKDVEFQFTYKPIHQNPHWEKDLLHFGLKHRVSGRRLLAKQPEGYFEDSLPLLAQGKKLEAAIFGVVRESHVPDFNDDTRVCFSRSAVLPDAASYTLYHCEQGDGCRHEPSTPKWFDACPLEDTGRNFFLSPFIRTAYAQDSKDWAIPSLTVLQNREDLFGIGYTRFKVAASSAMNKDFDGYFYDIAVNGWQANIDGLPGSYRAQAHDFSQPLSIEFGLQNLNFSGVNDGCDEIVLTLNFVKEGEPAGEPVTLRRSYVALRDARVKEIATDHGQYRWTGKYQRAPKMYDTEVFISSILIAKSLDFQTHQSAIENAKRSISGMKRDFDALGLKFEGRPLVAVIRPPLTQLSYGLAIGMVEETQQIRFTYENATAKRLRQFLLQQRARGGAYQSIIAPDTFLYTVRGDKSYMASPPVCADDR
jgi:hypothetical protein